MYNKWLKFKCKINKFILKIMQKNFYFENDLMFRNGFFVKILGGKVIIKSGCFFNNYCSINSLGKIEIGENCIFGEGVKIYDHNHRFENGKITNFNGYRIGKVTIGNNVWVGSNTVILKDVKIGDNVIIGAGCVICKDIPDNSIVKLKENLEIIPIK